MSVHPNSLASLLWSFKHRKWVRKEVRDETARRGEHAHAFVVRKLARSDITSKYRAVLLDVERALNSNTDRQS
jgi:hypothetical protein